MKKFYTVTEYLGDYPIEEQTFWGEKFQSKDAAEFVAETLFSKNQLFDHEDDHSHVADVDYYVVVEYHADDSGLGDAVYAVTINGFLRGGHLKRFLKKFE